MCYEGPGLDALVLGALSALACFTVGMAGLRWMGLWGERRVRRAC